jgi:ComF family protein
LNLVKKYTEAFLSLFYPKICMACSASLVGNEDILCTGCLLSLPETGYHKFTGNPVEQIFWGRLNLENATSLLFFDKGSKYRRLIHQLKYKGKKEIGVFLGKLLGIRLSEAKLDNIDLIVPIPLHPIKLRRRGYNQSEEIAKGLATIIKKPVVGNSLKRIIQGSSQTYKGRYDRWENAEGIFRVSKPELLKNKHVLLIDDVVTTGATLEAAGIAILAIEGTRISIATLAFTN